MAHLDDGTNNTGQDRNVEEVGKHSVESWNIAPAIHEPLKSVIGGGARLSPIQHINNVNCDIKCHE